MIKRILITSFGGSISLPFIEDFQLRNLEVFYADCDPHSKLPLLTKNFILVPPGNDPEYGQTLLEICKSNRIDMVIPGADEEAFALMRFQKKFGELGILAAVQDQSYEVPFSSKSQMYRYLSSQGLSIPSYHVVNNKSDLWTGARNLEYSQGPLLIKPDSGRGGRGIYMLSETAVSNKENWPVYSLEQMESLLGEQRWILMRYFDGIVIDVDVLCHPSGSVSFGFRKRFTNVTKNFSGNAFVWNPNLLKFTEAVFRCFPTKFLIDYDIYELSDGSYVLLEINPRPSGSTVSYLPYGINAYAMLADSYLHGKESNFPNLAGKKAYTFLKMVKG